MNRAAGAGSPRTRAAAFSLTEITLALAIIAVAMVAIIGVLPAGMTASRRAIDHTVVSTILEDAHERLRNQPLQEGPVSFSPAFYDERGVFIDPAVPAAERPRAIYRADIDVVRWQSQPANTSSLRPVTMAISWPLTAGGEAVGRDNPKTVVTSGVTSLAGPDWTRIDPQYVPKIEF